VRDYSTREVANLSGLSESQVRRWARDRLISPHKNTAGRWRYSFQDLALLRTARRLIDARLTLPRVTRALRLVREQLPDGRPLSAVRILVTGDRVVVKDRLSSWEPDSRQTTLDFDVQTLTASVAPRLARIEPLPPEPDDDAHGLYQAALDFELAGRVDEARQAYQAALRQDPTLVSARINLGRLLHNANRLAEAEALYRAALVQDPHNALAAYNLGVALEDQGRQDAAIEAYRSVLTIDETYADAHFNLARLLEVRGDKQGALRHLSRFKRLMHRD
jgi:tetratricopeptide (TPR) repeat protein